MYFPTVSHTCPPTWLVWFPGWGEDVDDAETAYGESAVGAVRWLLEKSDPVARAIGSAGARGVVARPAVVGGPDHFVDVAVQLTPIFICTPAG